MDKINKTFEKGETLEASELNVIVNKTNELVEVTNTGGSGVTPKNMIPVTYTELKTLRNTSKLNPGSFYRITDFVTTAVAYTDSSTGGKVKSANHPFDVIVLATDKNNLNEQAWAILHDGDTYFKDCNLDAWQLWYDLDNDNTKYAWADTASGKGVIYRMIDEHNNDCPYDFKNILMFTDKYTSNQTPDNYYYTFSYNVENTLYDGSVEKQVTNCYGNVMKKYTSYQNPHTINFNIFLNTSFGNSCSSNTFGNHCYSNTFGNSCYSNKFGYDCYSNTFGDSCSSNTFGNHCSSNTFGYHCYSNTFGSCYSNTFGNDCYSNTFGSCYSNIFGDHCYSNTFGNSCGYNTFGYSCYSNTFGNSCGSNTFRDHCYSNTFGNDCYSNTFGNDCYSNKFGYGCDSNTFGNSCSSNTFGNSCGYNIFGNGLVNRQVSSSNTILQGAEEYYDDGSGKVVPVRHPDLSTRPSILPYKIGGHYVYEQVFTKMEIFEMPKESTLLNVYGSYVDSSKNRKIINPSEMYVSPSNELIFPQLSEVSDVYIVIQYFIKSEEGSYYGYGY